MRRVLNVAAIYLLTAFSLLAFHTQAQAQAVSFASPANVKSIQQWAKCDGKTDDALALATAVTAARNGAFVLQIDCPLFMHVGTDITRPIFIDDNTSINFTSAGKLIVDNVLIPDFAIINTNNVKLTNWNVVYNGPGMPADPQTPGYVSNGVFHATPTITYAPSTYWHNANLTKWLAVNRLVFFNGTTAASDPVHDAAIFLIRGSSSNLIFDHMQFSVPQSAPASAFIPMVFGLTAGEADRCVRQQPELTIAPPCAAVPSHLTFSNISIDGSLFGWQGSAQNVSITNITSYRYSDLQDANGGNIGGVGKWFPPPHLFYINYQGVWDQSLFNKNITINHVIDNGVRVGKARDTQGNAGSGYTLSLKLGCLECSVNDYTSYRPDGFMDVLPSIDLAVTNVTATYNSAFLNYLYPALRFPVQVTPGFPANHNISFQNVTLTDLAASTSVAPISGICDGQSSGISFSNVNVFVKIWQSTGSLQPWTSARFSASPNVVISYAYQPAGQAVATHLFNQSNSSASECR